MDNDSSIIGNSPRPEFKIDELAKEIYSAISLDQAKEILRPYLENLYIVSFERHGHHSNVGPAKKLEEWSTCQYRFCKLRYDLLFNSEREVEEI
jgi:hypothetical protein